MLIEEVPLEENNAQRGKEGVLASVWARESAQLLGQQREKKREPEVKARKRGSYGEFDSKLQHDGCR